MTLEKQLSAKRIESEANRDQSQVEIMLAATQKLVARKIVDHALSIGDKIPLFNLPNALNSQIEIGELLKNGPIILTFYRGSWCPYCNLELRAYQQRLAEITSKGAQVIAISPELPDSSLSNVQKNALDFQVLSDIGNQVARQFGLVFKLPDELAQVYTQLNSDITKYNGDDSWELPLAATYVINKDAKITYAYVSADYLERAEPNDVIAQLNNLN